MYEDSEENYMVILSRVAGVLRKLINAISNLKDTAYPNSSGAGHNFKVLSWTPKYLSPQFLHLSI